MNLNFNLGVYLFLPIKIDHGTAAAGMWYIKILPAQFHKNLGSGFVDRIYHKGAYGDREYNGKKEQQNLTLALKDNIQEVPRFRG